MKTLKFPIKHLLKVSSFTVAIVLLPFAALALDIKDVPNSRQINGTWVTDMAGILDQPTEAQINSIITQLEQKNGAEIAVVTVQKTSPSASPKAFATALFNYWRIGKKSQNNGVLLLISKGERRVEIETGYGIEPILPNAQVSNIIDTKVTPKFKQGDFNGGTLAGTKALAVAIENSSKSNQLTPLAIAPNSPEVPSKTPNTSTIFTQVTTPVKEPTPNVNPLWGLLIAGGLITAIGTVVKTKNRVEIEPEGESRFKVSSRVCICATCKKKMEQVDDSIIQATLSEPEQVAQEIGSLKFEGWKCPKCSQKLTGLGFHRFAYQPIFGQFSECPNCQELTVKRTVQTLEYPTEFSNGERLITEKCQCCEYQTEREEIIPYLPPSPPPSSDSSNSYSSSSDSGSSYSSSSDSGSSYSGSSDSGSSYGGGSSDGGGAGGSW